MSVPPPPRSPDPARDPRLHHDALGGRSVFIAPRRADRPSDLATGMQAAAGQGAGCVFCAGNENLTPPFRLRSPANPLLPWQARIIPNRFPFVEDWVGTATAAGRHGLGRPAHGVHDVVIEAATHEASILAIEAAAWRDVWGMCHQRLAALATRSDLAWGTIFKNSGALAGASLEHVHSQLVALDFVPPDVEAKWAALNGNPALFAHLLEWAAAQNCIVAKAGGLVALVPPAPRQPLETWIVTDTPEDHFHATSPVRVEALADLTRLVVTRLQAVLPGAAYNWWLHQAPFATDSRGRWHWHLEILPRLASFAGFELATGCHVSTASPQESALLLRGG